MRTLICFERASRVTRVGALNTNFVSDGKSTNATKNAAKTFWEIGGCSVSTVRETTPYEYKPGSARCSGD